MNLRSQNSQDLSLSMDNSAMAAVNMTLDSEMMGGMNATQQEEEEEQWHAFEPEEEEDAERHVFDGDANVTKDTDVSNIELVRADESDGRISMVSCFLFVVLPINELPTSTCTVILTHLGPLSIHA